MCNDAIALQRRIKLYAVTIANCKLIRHLPGILRIPTLFSAPLGAAKI